MLHGYKYTLYLTNSSILIQFFTSRLTIVVVGFSSVLRPMPLSKELLFNAVCFLFFPISLKIIKTE